MIAINLQAHVYPLLELCRYAAAADNVVQDLNALSKTDHFKQQLAHVVPELGSLNDKRGAAQAANGIWLALELLRVYEQQQGEA